MDYQKIGFKAGLEIHQQLETHKLFCGCQSKITEESEYSFERVLRPTQSELGDVDIAAVKEAQKSRWFLYSASNKATCLVEADEEPPHAVNPEAVELCLTMAVLLHAKPVDEIQFMRKIVIDGSNTSGFQRTALVATGGQLRHVGIQTIALEEDAARKLGEKEKLVHYDLDRLGIPLIEIATSADIKNPDDAREIAEELGLMLRATGKVKKGLGTIRQDLNVSIAQGARVEIKGIQSLSAISRVAEQEAVRQMGVLEIHDILQERVYKKDFDDVPYVDLREILKDSKSNLVQKQLQNSGWIKGIRLPGYHSLLKREHTRLGREFAVYARLLTGIGGIIHSDEVPGYGITEKEVQTVKQVLHLDDADAFVIALGSEVVVDNALDAVLERARMFLDGVPEEVRRSLSDDSTEYMRPLPGAARMYPETDVPPQRVTREILQRISKNLPELPLEKHQRFLHDYRLNDEQIRQLFTSGYEQEFELLVKQFPGQTNIILRTLLNTLPELKNQGIPTDGAYTTLLTLVFSGLIDGRYAKEAIPQVLGYLLKHPGASLDETVHACSVYQSDEEEIRAIIKKILKEKASFVQQKGSDAVGPLMGAVMKQPRGKADGKRINTILKEEVKKMVT